jgi:hypothetical protein
MYITRIAIVALTALFGFLFHSTPANAQWLFTDLPKTMNVVDGHTAIDPSILRSRLVGIDWDQINFALSMAQGRGGEEAGIFLNLFQDVILGAVPDRREFRSQKNFTWYGHIDGIHESEITLVALDGVMAGNVRAAGRLFQIRYVGNGAHAVREIDESRFPPDGDPIPVSMPKHDAHAIPDPLAADSSARFDVMVLYTPAARSAAGGTTAMMALVNLAVAETNSAYSRSGVIPRVRLVYTGEVGYTEVGDFSTDLSRLRNSSDGFIDHIHALRNAFGADLVSLIIEGNGSLCGLGYLMTSLSAGFEASAFSVSARNCATGNYTFSHEMGHNMGLRHDRIADPSTVTVFPYSHGYIDITHNFRDIMGVASGCGGCPRIQNFSNPNVLHNGFPTGVPQGAPNSADAAASLNATAFTVANWRKQIAVADFDHDGESDVAVYETNTGNWFYVGSTSGFGQHLNFGGATFLPVPSDYDGDGVTDTAVYDSTNGNWFVDRSAAGFRIHPNFGGPGLIPVPGDYDKDGRRDLAVYQTNTGHWFFIGSTTGFGQHLALGGPGYIPVPGDYDGDGLPDEHRALVYRAVDGWLQGPPELRRFGVHPSAGRL